MAIVSHSITLECIKIVTTNNINFSFSCNFMITLWDSKSSLKLLCMSSSICNNHLSDNGKLYFPDADYPAYEKLIMIFHWKLKRYEKFTLNKKLLWIEKKVYEVFGKVTSQEIKMMYYIWKTFKWFVHSRILWRFE